MHYYTFKTLEQLFGRVTRSDIDETYKVDGAPTLLAFPFPENSKAWAFPAIGVFWKLTNGRTGKDLKQHTVGFCRRLDLPRGDEAYFPICGAEWMKGAWDKAKMDQRLKEAISLLPKGIDSDAFTSLTDKAVDFAKGESPCNFWKSYLAASGARPLGCKHCDTVAFTLSQEGKVVTTLAMLDNMEGATSGVPTEVRGGGLVDEFAKTCPADAKGRRKFPVLIQGVHGGGKTTEARAFAQDGGFALVVECHGHAGMEAIDFLGGMLPTEGDGKSLAWVDGPITEAFRSASEGHKTLLFIDEIYRVPRRERSVFLSALSPALKPDGTYVYRLKTGRAVPSGIKGRPCVMEMIEAPEAHLSVIATTNVGPGYDVEEDDAAASSRWRKLHYNPGDGKTLAILKGECARPGLAYSPKTAERLVLFMKNVRKLQQDGEAKLAPSVRELVRALHVAKSENDVADILRTEAHSWAILGEDGEPDAVQVSAIKKAIASAFK